MRRRIEFTVGHIEYEDDYEVLDDRALPKRVDVHFPGKDGLPALQMVLQLVKGAPQCTEIHLVAHEDGRPILPVDLSSIRVSEWTDELYAECATPVRVSSTDGTTTTVFLMPSDEEQGEVLKSFAAARKGKGVRRITPRLLKSVAEVYRQNIDDRPIKAVAKAFSVSERTASYYVTKARDPEFGFLPPTTRGKKKA